MVNKKVPPRQKSIYKYVPGDWICPTCEDLQFRRNQSCRICGTMNPMVLAQELALAAGMSYKPVPGVYPPQTAPQNGGLVSCADQQSTCLSASYYDASTNTAPSAPSSGPTSRFSSKEAPGPHQTGVEDISKGNKGVSQASGNKGKGKGSMSTQTGFSSFTNPSESYQSNVTNVSYLPDASSYAQAAAAANAAACGSGGYGAPLPPTYQAQATLGAINAAYLMQQNALLLGQPNTVGAYLPQLVGPQNLAPYYPAGYAPEDAFAQALAQQMVLKQVGVPTLDRADDGSW